MSEHKNTVAAIEESPGNAEEINQTAEILAAADKQQAEAAKKNQADEKPSYRERLFSRYGARGIL